MFKIKNCKHLFVDEYSVTEPGMSDAGLPWCTHKRVDIT